VLADEIASVRDKGRVREHPRAFARQPSPGADWEDEYLRFARRQLRAFERALESKPFKEGSVQMMKRLTTFVAVAMAVPVFAADSEVAGKHQAYAKVDENEMERARTAIEELRQADSGLPQLFDAAVGYVVFAAVGGGGPGVGAAQGTGVLYENGLPLGKTTLTQMTVGVQVEGQAYAEVVLFETENALNEFKAGRLALAAQAHAVAAADGASANAKYVDGVSVFTLAKGGMMAEPNVGGQTFSYAPFRKVTTMSSR
jgi:lipid-binding SYLF domain-containing protein